MSEMNSTRNGCRDVFHAFLVKNATYDSNLEIPCLAREVQKPLKLIAFSKAIGCKEFDAWIHFMKMMLLLRESGILRISIYRL